MIKRSTYSSRQGETLTLVFTLTEGDEALVSTVSAKMKKIVPGANNAIKHSFTVTKTGLNLWSLVINTAAIETTQYQGNVKVTLVGGEVIISEPFFVDVKEAVT